MKDLKSKDYKNLFRMEGEITCLHSEFFCNGSLSVGNPLVVYKNRIWESFIKKDKEKICNKKGLKLFNSKIEFNNFSKKFLKYIDFANKKIIPKYNKIPLKIAEKEFVNLKFFLSELWYFYGYTEFPYTDLVYSEMKGQNNLVLKNNINNFEELKTEGRKILNAYFFKNGVLPNILKCLSKQFLDNNNAEYLYSEEIINLYKGKKLDKKIILQRKKCYVTTFLNNKNINFAYNESLKLFNEFTRQNQSDIIKGVISYKGKVNGRVVIAPMLNDNKKINKIVQKMGMGDVLVAQSTTPELMGLCNKASAIVTDQGGLLSHAAIISRELKIPCIIGTKVATQILKNGDLVEVDANKGVVRIIETLTSIDNK